MTNASVVLVPIDKLVSVLLELSNIVISPVEVIAPHPSVPVVERFSSPKLIAPLESVILPLPSVRLPTPEPVAAVKTPHPSVPVVDEVFARNLWLTWNQ